jgi:LuxR family maltose regulon positive regulatory protein
VPPSIISTKLYIPPPPSNLIPRSRLIDKLDQGLNKKLSIISAPAGFGKTTLLSEFVSKCKMPVAWYSMDETDDDIVQFLTYLVAALQTIDQGIGVGVSNMLSSPQSITFEPLLTEVINQIARKSTHTLLVLDDYHAVDSLEIDQAILFLIANLPQQMHLAIATRTDPTFPLSRLRSQGQLTEIRSDDLRFSTEEAALFINKGMGLNISTEDISTLESRTEGWIAGLQLAAISLQRLNNQNEITRFVENFSSSHRYILDYLTDEVLQHRPEGTRDFLLQTSILKRLNAPLCQTVTRMKNSKEILEILDAANLFLIPLDNERCWYRYHHLFNDLLKKRLGLIQPEFVTELHLRAARWYKQNGWISEALDHFLAAKDHSSAADLVEQNARALLERSELATFKTWVDALPETQVNSRPWLCVYHAWALRLSGAPFDAVQARIEDAEAAIKKLEALHEDQDSSDETAKLDVQIEKLNGHIFGLKSFQQLYKENIPEVLKLTKQAQVFKFDESFVLASVSFARGWALRFSGNLEAAYLAFEDTVKYSLDSGNIYMAVAGLCRSAYGRVLGGELQRAYDGFQKAIDLATGVDGTQYPVAGYAYIYLGRICYEWNDLETAKRFLLKGIELCKRVGLIMDQVIGLVTLAQLQNALGNSNAMQEALDEAENLSQKMKTYVYVRRWVEDTKIRLWYTQGFWDDYFPWIETCDMAIDDDLDYNRDLEHIILARALVYAGMNHPTEVYIQDALILLSRLLEKAERANWKGKAIEIQVLQALAFQALGNDQTAIDHFEKAIIQAEPEGYVRLFIDEVKPVEELLRQAKKKGIAEDYVNRLLDAFKPQKLKAEVQSAISFSSSHLVEPLSAREMEVLKLLSNGATNQEIAGNLVIAVTTTKKHVSNIIGKLGVSNRTQAVAKARELDLI